MTCQEIIEVGDVAVFIDNIMVVIKTEEEYDEIVEEVLKKLAENDLFVEPEKYVWNIREVGFLEVIIGPDRVKMEKKKVQKVIDQPVPKSVKNIQKFLVLANYYRWFVKDFVRVAKPLHKITKKDVKWNWRERQQRAFEELKERFMIKPVLVTPDLDREMRVEADVSDLAMKEVLSMKYEDEKQRPITYISKSSNKTERNYKIHDKEMLVIIRYLEVWRNLLEGAKDQFEIWINHKNLEYFMKAQKS